MDEHNEYIFGDPEIDRQRLETQSRLIARYVRAHARDFGGDNVQRILDVGSGDGLLGFALQDVLSDAAVVGIDRNPAAVARANEHAQQEGRAAEFIVGDIQAGLPAGPFDLVLMSLVLLHTHDVSALLNRAYAVLRPGGTLWVIDNIETSGPNSYVAQSEIFRLLFTTLERIGGHPNILAELPQLAMNAGFTDYQRRETMSDHPMYTTSIAERTQVNAAGLGAIYNARPAISQVMGVPLARLDQMFAETTNFLMAERASETPPLFGVATARKP